MYEVYEVWDSEPETLRVFAFARGSLPQSFNGCSQGPSFFLCTFSSRDLEEFANHIL